ncbi:uncharacterized protein LOC133735595 [Rosa rugosa]|uniref:uncharacterized protein LOC133735595 n=1 Tax=Rosa rugosa TaxID=74645 RepID=UPI002B40B741|nr:uncharacterized protein LOC133735595 [Rosa rugosa]
MNRVALDHVSISFFSVFPDSLSPLSQYPLIIFTLFFPSHKTTWRRQQASSPLPPSSPARCRHCLSLLSLLPPLSGSLCIARTLSLTAVSKQATTSPRKPQNLSPEMQPLLAWERLSRNMCSQFHFLRALTQHYGCLWLVSLLNLAWCFLQTQRSWE